MTTPPPTKRISGWWLLAGAIAAIIASNLLFGACDSDESSKSESARTTTTIAPSYDPNAWDAPPRDKPPQTSNVEVAAAAEQVVRTNFMLGPDEPFYMYECSSEAALCWAQYITGFTFRSGVLRVALQVNRNDALGQEIAENTARGVRNFIQFGDTTGLSAVDWVVATDGVGVDIAQQQMD